MNNNKLLLALDGGTGSFRAVAFDLKGRQIAISQKEWTHPSDQRYPGSIDFDCKKNWEIISSCIKNLFSNNPISPSNIVAISTTSMREGFVVYDDVGNELMAFSNVDARSKQEAEALKKTRPHLESEFYQITGESFALSAVPRLLWLMNNKPEFYKKMNKINMLNDWIAFKLTGKLTTEPSNASTTGLFSLKKRDWDHDLAKKIGLKETIFPEVIESGQVIGSVSEYAAELTNLLPGTPVVAGGGDAQLGCIGIGATTPGDAALFGGSFWQLEYNIPEPKIDPSQKLRINCHAERNIWQYESLAWNPGLAMRWYRDAFCQSEKERAVTENKNVYSILDESIQDIPAGCHGMFALFSNEMDFLNLKHAAPTFTNFKLDSEKFNKFTFYKSIMESAGIVTLGHWSHVTALTNHKPAELVFAGGASNNPNWCQIIADILGVTVKTPLVKEATALGAAFLAGLGVGIYDSLEDTAPLIQWDKSYQPNLENHKIYQQMYSTWKTIYDTQLTLSDDGLTEHMWIAPGVK